MEKEIWKPIERFNGKYEVSNLGRVRNNRGHILSPDTRDNEYFYVLLRDVNAKRGVHVYIHRLVAEAFIPNPNNYPIINHINENRQDNSIENLEWCTNSHNACASTKRRKWFVRVVQKDLEGNVIAVHENIHEAAKSLGDVSKATNICRCMRGRAGLRKDGIPTAFGYIWEYEKIEQRNITNKKEK